MFVPVEMLYKTVKYLALKAVLTAEERFHFCFVREIICFALLEIGLYNLRLALDFRFYI